MPDLDGFPIHEQVVEVRFEAAACQLLRSEPGILASRLLYHRAPVLRAGPGVEVPRDLAGRRLSLFEKAQMENNRSNDLGLEGKSLLRLIPRIIPEGASLYRLVLEHGDFGIHNMTITTDAATSGPLVTPLFDWETGHIVPATLSDPMAVAVDLTTDDEAAPSDQEEYVE
ncbi:hypothetical protein RB597_006010 [Gaeumannomyces tritici]